MLKTIVVDDEWYNLEEIGDMVDNTGVMRVAKKYQNPLKALEEISDILPDVAFVDIEMPEIDGITLAERLLVESPKTNIVFITSWNQYAVQAFDLNALDYIMKPIKKERFNKMVEKIKDEYKPEGHSRPLDLKINCFRSLKTTIGGVPVKWERAKAEELFAYLLVNHNSFVHKDKIIEELWPDYDHSRALSILQTAVCKIRNIFSEISDNVTLSYSGSKYCLSIKKAECDYFKLEGLLSSFDLQDKNTYPVIGQALEILDEGFLSENGYIWSTQKEEELRKTFEDIMRSIVSVYMQESNESEAVRYLKLLARMMPYDEEVNYILLETYKRTGNEQGLMLHYKWMEKVLKEEYDIVPSDKIKSVINKNK